MALWGACVLLLCPSALMTHGYLFGTAGFSGSYFFAALFGIFCAMLSFWLFAKQGWNLGRVSRGWRLGGRFCLLAALPPQST